MIEEQKSDGKTTKMIITAFAIIGILMILLAAKTVFANSSSASGNAQDISGSSKLALNVGIPCSGHAALIIYEVKKLNGVKDVKYTAPTSFDVYYDSSKVSQKEILGLDIFKEFKANVE